MPPQDRLIILLLRAECLSVAATKALQAGNRATAARMRAEMEAAIKEAREIAERMRAQ